MTNPFNPEAGDVPAPVDARDRALAERSARIVWRAFPYFAWRYGQRGRSFGRSDAGWLVTLAALDEGTARRQVAWLVGVLAPRGMPSLLVEYQLEVLGRLWRRERRPQPNVFLGLASELRSARLGVLDARIFDECERLCADVAGRHGTHGAGRLVAAASADRARGIGEFDAPLVRWFAEAAGEHGAAFADACAAALALAREHCRPAVGSTP